MKSKCPNSIICFHLIWNSTQHLLNSDIHVPVSEPLNSSTDLLLLKKFSMPIPCLKKLWKISDAYMYVYVYMYIEPVTQF